MFHAVVDELEPISLAELGSKALLDRVETKYAMPQAMLPSVLAAIGPHYFVLEVEGQRLNHYRTLYYDTADFAMYRRHHVGAGDRYKVRARQYVESQVAFLEIKHRTKKKRTVKSRIRTTELVTHLADGPAGLAAEFVDEHCPYTAEDLAPRLWNSYTRITLASKSACERVTLDLDLSFDGAGQRLDLPGIVIAEVKQGAHAGKSDFVSLMRQRGVRKTGFSKYCLGVSLLHPEVKHNHFRTLQRLVAKIMSAGGNYGYHRPVSWLSDEFARGVGDRAWHLLPSPA